MDVIRNVSINTGVIHPVVLGTSGVASCLAVVIELENEIFIYHVGPDRLNISTTCSINDAQRFLTMIFKNLYELKTCAIIKSVFIIGGWNDANYLALRKQIDLIRNRSEIKMKQNNTSSPNDFNAFLSKIILNLIGFNMPVKKSNGEIKNQDEDDNPCDYIVDSTIIYDRSTNPHVFIIGQYAGFEYQMHGDRDNSLLQVIYEFDPTSQHLQAFMSANARQSLYYTDFLQQVLFNVKDQSNIHYSFSDENLERKINALLSRIEKSKDI